MANDIDKRDQFRTELEFVAGPMRDGARINYESAIKFADAAIKSTVALNGGALVALPALIALFKIDPKPAFYMAFSVFVVGLVCSATTGLLGYLSAMANSDSIEKNISVTMAEYASLYQYPLRRPVDIPMVETERDTLASRSNVLLKWAVGTGIASGVAFVIGAAISAYVLILLSLVSAKACR